MSKKESNNVKKEDISSNEIIGTCLSMCPLAEIEFRTQHNLLHKYEISLEHKVQSKTKVDHSLCVKEFHRSAAGDTVCKPSDLRPGSILLDTIDYLFLNILPIEDSFVTRYNFIFNRLRSIRQDAVIQQLNKTDVYTNIKILEKCARFYLYSIHMISKQPDINIDAHINLSHLQDCFNFLSRLYSQNQELFEENNESVTILSAYILTNLDSSTILYSILWNFSKNIRIMEPLNTAIKLYLLYHCNNFVKFSKLVLECVNCECNVLLFGLSLHMQNIRVKTLKILSHSHHSKVGKFPINTLSKWLMLNSDASVFELCKSCNVKILEPNSVMFNKTDFNYNKTKMVPINGCVVTESLQKLSIYDISDCLIGQ